MPSHSRFIAKRGQKRVGSAGRASAVGIEFAGAVVICLLIGNWADGKLGTGPWLTLLGLVVGSLAGFRALFSLASQSSEEDDGSSDYDKD